MPKLHKLPELPETTHSLVQDAAHPTGGSRKRRKKKKKKKKTKAQKRRMRMSSSQGVLIEGFDNETW